jgi:hypothetical protein
MKIQELHDQNATQEAIVKELREQLEKTGQEVPEQQPKHEPIMEAEEDPQELPQVAPAPLVFPQPNLYEKLMQDITENPPTRAESQGSSLFAQE